jgi:nicotinate-nucleotide adenylyltransferase
MGLSGIARLHTIGLLGGSFDPIHVGHIAIARAAAIALKLDEVQLLPAGQPWQKKELKTSAADRLAMVEIAVKATPTLGDADAKVVVNAIEALQSKPTFTVETLEALYSPNNRLVLILGSDQLHNLPTWHRYEDLLKYCHLAVTQRQAAGLQNLPPVIDSLVANFGRDALPDAPSGTIVFFRMPPVAVSSTQLRMALKAKSPQTALVANLLPKGVFQYITEHQLYQ